MEHLKKQFIQKSVKRMKQKGTVGSLTRMAHAAGESPMQFARAHYHSSGVAGQKSRWAVNVNKGK